MPPQLLKRLAEAALGPHGPDEQFWVCRFEPDAETHRYDIKGPFPTKTAADAKLAQVTASAAGARFGVFGPYQRAATDPVTIFLKDPAAEILKITVEVKIKDKQKHTEEIKVVDIPPKAFDALFWGPPAVEKFVLPYYTGASGIDYAVQVRNDYIDGKAYLLAHSGDTEQKVFTPATKTDPAGGGETVFLTPL
jgi:hypothetical protein